MINKGKRYTDEFKRKTVNELAERGCLLGVVAERFGTTTDNLCLWIRKYGERSPRQAERGALAAENACPRAELKRMTEGHDILKKTLYTQSANAIDIREYLIGVDFRMKSVFTHMSEILFLI